MDLTLLIENFSKASVPLNEEEIEALKDCVTVRHVKRRQFILHEGDICNHYTFVIEGCFKMYKVDLNGKEHNLHFTTEESWIADLGSFFTKKKSELYIEAIEKSTILQIERDDLLSLYDNYPKFDKYFRLFLEKAFAKEEQRSLHNISSTAEERYLHFLETYPNLFNRISNVQIASFLGVTPEFLSVLRKRLIKR
ncbi:Crp/Fnr family transcriptional regulator [Tamlana fucoidanivorans]|uniref:Crp/Fnr family transcriptional regulator n=1 Tax=Allotamlana fucoidanivorans TaxID=2583814 RepID=A0A5C4SQ03_9FLAO|nr:Crp/Fnr family transcriptional regulator [Tamlana fucoidanivorans]TNJ45634.1 Crp/Fnr family transcriptional regulator [Tamlana fucoidanivorans]